MNNECLKYSCLSILQVEKAADIYIKMHLPLKGSKCYEEGGQFKQAITLLIKHNLFEAAIDCLHRYQILVQVHFVNKIII